MAPRMYNMMFAGSSATWRRDHQGHCGLKPCVSPASARSCLPVSSMPFTAGCPPPEQGPLCRPSLSRVGGAKRGAWVPQGGFLGLSERPPVSPGWMSVSPRVSAWGRAGRDRAG